MWQVGIGLAVLLPVAEVDAVQIVQSQRLAVNRVGAIFYPPGDKALQIAEVACRAYTDLQGCG